MSIFSVAIHQHKLKSSMSSLPNEGQQRPSCEEFHCTICNFHCFSNSGYVTHTKSNGHILKVEIHKGTNYEILNREKKRWSKLKLPSTCPICLLVFTEKKKFVRHINSHEQLNAFSCVHCHATFQNRNDFASHLKRHLDIKNIKCQYCNKLFDKTRSLKSHLLTRHGKKDLRPRNFKCTECGNAFLSKLAVNRHMRFHTGFRPETCVFCGQGFHTKFDLLQHQKVHSGEKPFKCTKCPYTARTAQLLKRHQQVHSTEKPFVCKECSYKCKYISGLKRHMNQHSGKKPFKCPYCILRCANIENLRKHIKKVKKHRGLKVYPCSHCNSFSTDDGNEYLNHMKQYHLPHLDLKTSTAAKLSGIQVDDSAPDFQESDMEEEIQGTEIFNGSSSNDLCNKDLTQHGIGLDSSQPSLGSMGAILPEISLCSTIDSLNENALHCFENVKMKEGIDVTEFKKRDIFLSSMTTFDTRDPCTIGTFSSAGFFGETTNMVEKPIVE